MNSLFSILPYFGIAGCTLILLAIAISAFAYSGKARERYSIINHFISELGEIGVSRGAVVFNGGLILGGLVLLPYLLLFGLRINNFLAWLGMLAGAWAAFSCVAVGIFPMNNLPSHTKAAMSYFRAGLVTILLFTLAIFFQTPERLVITRHVNWIGLLSVCTYAYFIFFLPRSVPSDQAADILNPENAPQRPRFWLLPTIEWAVFFSTMLWFLTTALLIN